MFKPKTIPLVMLAMVTMISTSAFAQRALPDPTGTTTVQRDVNQQTRIEEGLKSGQLTTREAAGLERKEARIDRMEANALKDGTLTPAEQTRINRQQNKVSRNIYTEKHDAQTGNPNSASSQRMQADVQRNVNQEQRIRNGLKDGSLTKEEAARLERGQARESRLQARAGADGHVGAAEQRHVQRTENRQSRRIFNERHDQ
ncbi:hypothetical protein QN362_01890 [Actimicrobium sp. CCC2.4]|uniref:hypothetical protein n=1 Tax=Actimicrobium sp. CCC2.4 TaxID=3048606 RepID=UPI002AC8EBF2|nr:hypothetical protein [Actimicrobium sp. CCC2.4]MEB0134074.1 hypothetical protein [Actimicrobium sp. CCC2.4]WPX31607.1 hypothetical protein RHM62_15370 [Actimicrobium sp. CCC2.4]